VITINFFLEIDFRSRTPIYEQIIRRVHELVLDGVLKADEKLPSIRELAAETGINPNTIQKAYAELERQEVIYNLSGRGTFVSDNLSMLTNSKYVKILVELEELVKEAKKYQVDYDALVKVIDIVYYRDIMI
jgi:GntR family transcriptional regulator